MNILLLSSNKYKDNRIEKFLKSSGYNVICKSSYIDMDLINDNRIDFIISYRYDYILKEPIISEYWHKIINIHATLLPYGKGTYGNVWNIFENKKIGVSIHFIDSGIDTGDIIFQKEVFLENELTLQSSLNKLLFEVENLFFEKWEKIINEDYILIKQSQLNNKGTYHNRRLSQKLMTLFPKKWETKIYEVKEVAIEYSNLNEEEIHNKINNIKI